MKNKDYLLWLAIFSINMALVVSIGALAAHAWKDILIERGKLQTFQTAVMFHFYHTLALGLLAILKRTEFDISKIYFYGILIGILFFSGSLYILSFSSIPFLVWITPLGGMIWIFVWVTLSATLLKRYYSSNKLS